MTITQEKIKSASKNLEEIQAQIKQLEELKDVALTTLLESINQFNKIVSKSLLENIWFMEVKEAKKISDSISALETIMPIINQMPVELHEDLSNEDELISVGLFAERFCRLIQTIKYVSEMKVPSTDYRAMSWEDRIRSFAVLPDNWDGEGAQEVPKTRIQSSIKFIEKHASHLSYLKMVYPSMIGSVGLIYQIENNKITVLFLSKSKIEVSVLDESSNLKVQEQMEVEDLKSLESLIV